MKDKQSVKMREAIARCVWKTDEFDEPDMERLKIDSEVASDNDKGEFLEILREGHVGAGWKSAFARNFAYFQKKIEQLVSEWPTVPKISVTGLGDYTRNVGYKIGSITSTTR